jgi:NAD(P)-dependent dehydrogenase (short-subunit alcohol dehydrogenase family)
MSDSFILHPDHRPRPESQRRNVVVTGAGGKIGTRFAEEVHEQYDLKLLVHSEENLSQVEPYGQTGLFDLTDLDGLKESFDGMDTVVHLAARASPEQVWGPLLESNIIGAYNVFVAAESAGCRRVVFASSIHAVSGTDPERQVLADGPVSPGDLYGVSKCFGEAMGRFMATQRDLSCICIRIGAFQPVDKARQADSVPMMDAFVSHRDLNQLLRLSIDDERLLFAIVHGLSRNRFNRMNIDEARELLGYDPRDDFTEENPHLEDLQLSESVKPHSEAKGQPTGIREEL